LNADQPALTQYQDVPEEPDAYLVCRRETIRESVIWRQFGCDAAQSRREPAIPGPGKAIATAGATKLWIGIGGRGDFERQKHYLRLFGEHILPHFA
jgi:hypothetical protein